MTQTNLEAGQFYISPFEPGAGGDTRVVMSADDGFAIAYCMGRGTEENEMWAIRIIEALSARTPSAGAGEAELELIDARMVLENKIANATGALANLDWRPRRTHIEGMRNAMTRALDGVTKALSTLREGADRHPGWTEKGRDWLDAGAPIATTPDKQAEGESGLVERLRAYRPTNEWGEPVHHVICDEAADRIDTLSRRLAEAKAKAARLPSMLPPAATIDQSYLDGWRDAMAYASAALRQSGEEG
jgi:hypothetical protein